MMMGESIARQGFYQFRERLATKIVASRASLVLADQWFPSSKTTQELRSDSSRIKVKRPYFQLPLLWH